MKSPVALAASWCSCSVKNRVRVIMSVLTSAECSLVPLFGAMIAFCFPGLVSVVCRYQVRRTVSGLVFGDYMCGRVETKEQRRRRGIEEDKRENDGWVRADPGIRSRWQSLPASYCDSGDILRTKYGRRFNSGLR